MLFINHYCLQLGDAKKAASCAYTFLEYNPDHVLMTSYLERYVATPGNDPKDIVSLDQKKYQVCTHTRSSLPRNLSIKTLHISFQRSWQTLLWRLNRSRSFTFEPSVSINEASMQRSAEWLRRWLRATWRLKKTARSSVKTLALNESGLETFLPWLQVRDGDLFVNVCSGYVFTSLLVMCIVLQRGQTYLWCVCICAPLFRHWWT